MLSILVTELPGSVQRFIRSVRERETMLVTDDDGAVVASITAIPNRRGTAAPGPSSGPPMTSLPPAR